MESCRCGHGDLRDSGLRIPLHTPVNGRVARTGPGRTFRELGTLPYPVPVTAVLLGRRGTYITATGRPVVYVPHPVVFETPGPGRRCHPRRQSERRAHVTDENDVVIAIAASLYASRATDDALRAEPPIQELANEAWDLYHKLERAVRSSPRQHGDALIERS